MSNPRTVGQVGVKYQKSKHQLTPELAKSSGVLNVHLEPCSVSVLHQTPLTPDSPDRLLRPLFIWPALRVESLPAARVAALASRHFLYYAALLLGCP